MRVRTIKGIEKNGKRDEKENQQSDHEANEGRERRITHVTWRRARNESRPKWKEKKRREKEREREKQQLLATTSQTTAA